MGKLHLETYVPHRDREFLKQLAGWCERFSPAVALKQPDCLLMDLTGLAVLFGSEHSQATHIHQTFHQRGLVVRVAVADTYAAAWALAHYSGEPITVVTVGESSQAISSLPIAALDLPEAVVAILQELGIEHIGVLAALPRDSLAARFNSELLAALDAALDGLRETLVPHRAPPEYAAEFELESPLTDRHAVEAIVAQLLKSLVASLAEVRRGIEALVYEFSSDVAPPLHMPVALYQPTANLKHLRELTALQLERLAMSAPVSKVRVSVCSTAPLGTSQLDLFDEEHLAESRRQLSLLVNRLSSRLGASAVLRSSLRADAQAEFAYRYRPLTEIKRTSFATNSSHCGPLERPLRLLPKPTPVEVLGIVEGPPSQLHWRSQTHHIHRSWGPERIETGWWRGSYVQRDYYRVETVEGNRYWLFRRRDGRWFLHGIFA